VTVDFPWGWGGWDDSGDWGGGPIGNSQNGGGTVQPWPNGGAPGIPGQWQTGWPNTGQ
jgi:hypothetical protein